MVTCNAWRRIVQPFIEGSCWREDLTCPPKSVRRCSACGKGRQCAGYKWLDRRERAQNTASLELLACLYEQTTGRKLDRDPLARIPRPDMQAREAGAAVDGEEVEICGVRKIQQAFRTRRLGEQPGPGSTAHLCGNRRKLRVVSNCQLVHYTGSIGKLTRSLCAVLPKVCRCRSEQVAAEFSRAQESGPI